MKNTSHSTLGTVALAFYEFDTTGKKPRFRFINDSKWMTCHPKWKSHLQYLRGRRFAAVLQETVLGTGKSGISMQPLGILAVFEDAETAAEASIANGNMVNRSPDPLQKIVLTQRFAEHLHDHLHTSGQGKNFYESTECIIGALVAARAPRTPALPTTSRTTLRF